MSASALIRPAEVRPRTPKSRGGYFVQTWGCQMNEEDSEQLALSLEAIGFNRSDHWRDAKVVLLNTCSVRRKPEDKAFSLLGEIALFKQQHPDMVVGVCGCMAQARATEIRRRAPHVDFVLGTGDINQVAGLVEETLQTRRFQSRTALPERKGAIVDQVPGRQVRRATKLKAFVPIQYGCDKFCAFCIVPTTRGRERSRPTIDIIEEVAALVDHGTREVTLLGQTVNSYGKNLPEGRVPFARLLELLGEIPGLKRIRYTSPYPKDFKADLIETIRDHPKVMEHVHMPAQSGDNTVLEAMRRTYTRESFLSIVHALREAVPDVSLTTDLIVGFPGETDEQFEATYRLIEEVRFDGAFMFAYSPRPNTPAAQMQQVPAAVKSERLNRLMTRQNEITAELNSERVGKVFEVLVEGPSPKNPSKLQGYTREFRMMHFEGPVDLIGETVHVEAIRPFLWGLEGKLL